MRNRRTDGTGWILPALLLPALLIAMPTRAQAVPRAPLNRRPAPVARQAVDGHATPEQVQTAIERAQQYLMSKEFANGSFEPKGAAPGGQEGGVTALATYALLASEVPSTEPHVAAAVAHLKSINILGTYALGLRCQVWYQLSLELDPNETKQSPARRELASHVERDAGLLLHGVNREGNPAGMYTYFVNNVRGSYDHSCSNYGTMGVWACAQAGAEIPQAYWELVDAGWKRHQLPNAGWAYQAQALQQQQPTASMTAGGLVNLFITQEFLNQNRAADCKGNIDNPAIEAAIRWLGKNSTQLGGGHTGYTMFNVQRVGAESGYIAFDNFEWYSRGADSLVASQGADGAWGDVTNTAFGLAFLSLGRAPVVMNKLQYEDPAGKAKFGNWQQRPRDAANITHWIEKQLHKRLNWQVVNLSMPMDVLHQSPILYISGNQKLAFTPEQSATLKRYVQEGGLIVANADCGSKAFAESFKQLGEQLFPDYAFRALPAKHPIFNDELFSAKLDKKLPPVEGLGNQARELMLLFSADDPSRAWQTLPLVMQKADGVIPREEQYHIAGNLYYYSTERGLLRDKTKTWILPEGPPGDKKLTVARLEYDGNWDPEPFGWQQIANRLRKEMKMELELPRVRLGADALDTVKYRIAYLTGTSKLQFTDKQRADLKRFAYEGGLVIVDAAGGSAEFAASAQDELKVAFGRDLELVPVDHPVFSNVADLHVVKYREKAKKMLGDEMTRPMLKMIQEDGKPRVFFSPLDLAVGMVGQPIDGIAGYHPDSAAALMVNMLIFGLNQH